MSRNDEPDIVETPGGVKLCEDGKYRWIYEYRMFKNPAQLFFLWRIFLWIILITAAVLIVMAFIVNMDIDDLFYIDFKPNELYWREIRDVFISMGMVALVGVIVLFGLGTISYLILAIVYKGSQIYLFEMDETGINMMLSPKTFSKNEGLFWLSALASLSPNKPTNLAMDDVLLSKNTQSSDFGLTRTALVKKELNCIHLRQMFGYNLVYTEPEDFDFVWDYIKARLPEKCRVKKFCRLF